MSGAQGSGAYSNSCPQSGCTGEGVYDLPKNINFKSHLKINSHYFVNEQLHHESDGVGGGR